MTEENATENDADVLAMSMRHANGDHFEPIRGPGGQLGFAATERGAMVLTVLRAASEKLGVEAPPTPGLFFVANYAARFSQEFVTLAVDKIASWSAASMGTIPFNVHLAGEAFAVSALVATVEAVWSSVLKDNPGDEVTRSLSVFCLAGDAFGAVKMRDVLEEREGRKERRTEPKPEMLSDMQVRAILRRPRGLA